ncbi:MAG: diacylglycerol kinase [Micavibrio aeruginosavorus]|uniref:Diacylglycerol kinase n=1 Tax=Micavibrio aeruginosavorus TaxID=349221 RepID=A0A2W5HMT3_9BACT|nr:MAG: diacylglycerol kinase [Micavibrio aeruginosavorus]
MPKPLNNTGLKRLYNAFFFSMDGIKATMRTEEAFRTEIYLSVIFIPLGLWLGDTAIEKIILAGTILLVFIVELLNTAVERAIDRISFDHHELSKEAKDMGSAAVLFSLILMLMSWGLILFF